MAPFRAVDHKVYSGIAGEFMLKKQNCVNPFPCQTLSLDEGDLCLHDLHCISLTMSLARETMSAGLIRMHKQ